MKRKSIRMCTISVIVACMTLPFLLSCNEDQTVDNKLSILPYSYSIGLNQDLKKFAEKHLEIVCKYLDNSPGWNTQTRGNNELELNMLFNDIDNNIQLLTKKYDLYADIPEKQKRPDCISEDSLIMMQLEPEIFLSYIKKNKSSRFYKIYENAMNTGYLSMTADDIIADNQLYLNEKYSLLLALPSFQQTIPLNNTLRRTRDRSETDDFCLDKYKSARGNCAFWYGISCAGSCLGGVVTIGLGVFLATVQLNNCLDQARDSYIYCQKFGVYP